MNYGLPTSVNINGEDVEIRTDFRVILEIMEALNDADLDDADRGSVILSIFYPNLDKITDYEEALNQLFIFLSGGKQEENKKKKPRLIDWEHDFEHIIAPVNRVLGYEARAVPYDLETNKGGLHWWTFLSAYMEIGKDCTMSYIVSIRDKLARGKKLDKEEQRWYRQNRELVDIPAKYSEDQKDILKEWT